MNPKILIISPPSKDILGASDFLKSHGWISTHVDSLALGVLKVQDLEPDFIVISMSFPIKIIIKIPKLIASSFNTTCVVCSNDHGPRADSLMQRSGMTAMIHGKPSGPAIFQKIKSLMEKDPKHKSEEKETPVDSSDIFGALHHLSDSSSEPDDSTVSSYVKDSDSIGQLFEMVNPTPEANSQSGEQLFQSTDVAAGETLEITNALNQKSSLYRVREGDFKGFYFVALSHEAQRLPLEELQEKIRLYIKEYFQPPWNADLTQILATKMDIASWATGYSHHILDHLSEGNQIAISFIEPKDLINKSSLDTSQGMISVPINGLHSKVTIDYNLYVFLEKNKKYFHYIKAGNIIPQDKIEKLQRHNAKIYCKLIELEKYIKTHIRISIQKSLVTF